MKDLNKTKEKILESIGGVATLTGEQSLNLPKKSLMVFLWCFNAPQLDLKNKDKNEI